MSSYILDPVRMFILDMDGTIYLGGKVFPYTLDFLDFLKSSGIGCFFFTNNASGNPGFYARKLKKMGIHAKSSDILTSGDVTVDFLREHRAGRSVYLLGTHRLRKTFRAGGIRLVENSPDIVVVSFDTTLTYDRLEKACRFIREGAEYLSTHCDINCPTESGFVPDSGSICAAVTASTGRPPRFFGKPFKETIEAIIRLTGYGREQIAIIGDRLYTDIKTGTEGGIISILVLSGETKKDDLDRSSVKPDLVFDDLSALMEDMKHRLSG